MERVPKPKLEVRNHNKDDLRSLQNAHVSLRIVRRKRFGDVFGMVIRVFYQRLTATQRLTSAMIARRMGRKWGLQWESWRGMRNLG